MASNDQVVDHFSIPRNVGGFAKEDLGVGTGIVGVPVCRRPLRPPTPEIYSGKPGGITTGMTDIDRTGREGWLASRFACFVTIAPMVALTCIVSLLPLEALGAEPTPTETVNGIVIELFSILKEAPGQDRSQARRREIERVIRRNVHYEEMAKRSLGVSWMQMDDGARNEYVGLFVHLLRDALANRMTQYSGEEIRYLSEQRKSTCAEVRTRLVGYKVDTTLDFRLINQDGRWLVYDAVMDGTSLVGTYRAQFASIIRDASLAGLMERLQANTLLVKLFDTQGS